MVLKAENLKNENPSELSERLRTLKKKLLEMKFQHAAGALTNPLQIRSTRRDIARIKSVLREKQNEQ